MIARLHPDVACVDFGLALECLLDLRLYPLWGDRRGDDDRVRHAGDPPDVAHHPLDLAALEIVVDLSLECHPAVLDAGLGLAGGDLDVPVQDAGNRRGDLGVVPRRPGQPHLQVIGHRLDSVDAPGGPLGGKFLGVGRRVAGQGDCPVRYRYPDGFGVGYLRIPSQLADDVVSDLIVGLHRLPLVMVCW